VHDAELGVERSKAVLNSSEARVIRTADLAQLINLRSPPDTPLSTVSSRAKPVKVGEYALASFSTTPLLTVADMSQINTEAKSMRPTSPTCRLVRRRR
jgi:HlyD family secretion protein